MRQKWSLGEKSGSANQAPQSLQCVSDVERSENRLDVYETLSRCLTYVRCFRVATLPIVAQLVRVCGVLMQEGRGNAISYT